LLRLKPSVPASPFLCDTSRDSTGDAKEGDVMVVGDNVDLSIIRIKNFGIIQNSTANSGLCASLYEVGRVKEVGKSNL